MQAAPGRKSGSSGGGDNTQATIGLVLAIIGLVSCGLVAIPGLILSIRGLSMAKSTEGEPGKNLAIAGMIVSILALTVKFGLVVFKLASNG